MIRVLLFLIAALAAAANALAAETASAQPPSLMLPAGCSLGMECWVVNYIDSDPAAATVKDFRCGPRSYDGHDGTDIGVRDGAAMKAGVNVLAAADGTVLRARDGIEDKHPTPEDAAVMKAERRECGNGVVIDHGGGWKTIYCHLQKDSVVVKPGDRVRTGQDLGRIGQSGMAEFPHVHFGVFRDADMIDPFTGRTATASCDPVAPAQALWRPELSLAYEPAAIFASGFKGAVPDFEAVKQDAAAPQTLSRDGLSALTFWTGFYGVQAGDKIRLEIRDPAGAIWAGRDIVQEKTRARQYYYVGKNMTDPAVLAPGIYRAIATLNRDVPAGREPVSLTRETEISIK